METAGTVDRGDAAGAARERSRRFIHGPGGLLQGRRANLEAAATLISDIANEGDKRIQAIRQRLAKAGHTHNTDVVTKEDFMFINSKERKDLIALARRVAQLGEQAKPAVIRSGNTKATKRYATENGSWS